MGTVRGEILKRIYPSSQSIGGINSERIRGIQRTKDLLF
jgi:hypothetical protein